MSTFEDRDPSGGTSRGRERASTAHGGGSSSLPTGSTLHMDLRRATAVLHQDLEANLNLLAPPLSLIHCRRVLCIFHGFYVPVEAGLAKLAASTPPVGFPFRTRVELLKRDLLAVGLSPRELAELPRCLVVPRMHRLEHLAGCLYVLEGACLGGQVIARALREQLGLSEECGSSFFAGEGDGTRARWTLVLTWLDSLVHAGVDKEEIVGSACETFGTFARWAKQQGASP